MHVVLVNGFGHRWSYHVRIENAWIDETVGDGIVVAQTYYLSMYGTRVQKSGNHAVALAAAVIYAQVYNCVLSDSGRITKQGCGVMIQPALGRIAPRKVLVADVRIENAYRAGGCFHRTVGDVFYERVSIMNKRDPHSACYALDNATFNNTDPICSVRSNRTYTNNIHSALPIPQAAGAGCMNGLLFREVCCPATCAYCGGSGCGALANNGTCCANTIRTTFRECGKSLPPCIVPEYMHKAATAEAASRELFLS